MTKYDYEINIPLVKIFFSTLLIGFGLTLPNTFLLIGGIMYTIMMCYAHIKITNLYSALMKQNKEGVRK